MHTPPLSQSDRLDAGRSRPKALKLDPFPLPPAHSPGAEEVLYRCATLLAIVLLLAGIFGV